ncbi:RNA polymerase sigma factor SigA [Galdieria sulphuraria]|nr:RNA polymerase sigma factor SigA [Galdieria sulphuraria]
MLSSFFKKWSHVVNFQKVLLDSHLYSTRPHYETHTVSTSRNNRIVPLFILSLPQEQSKPLLDPTFWWNGRNFAKYSPKTRSYQWLYNIFFSWNKLKRKNGFYWQLQRIELNKNNWIQQHNFRFNRYLQFLVVVLILLNKEVSICLERNVTSSILSSCQTQEVVKDGYFDSFKFHPKYLKRNDSTLNETSNRKSSPRLGRTNPFQRSVTEQIQPFLYRKAKHHRLDHKEERECLSILQTYRELEEKKMERESLLNRKMGIKEWSYLCNISELELRRWNKLARQAKHKLITSHLQLINAICRNFLQKGLSFDDLVQEGVIGLLKAVEKFDLCRGLRFSTYASWWIRHSLQRAVNQYQHLVRLPVHISDALKTIRRERRFLSYQLGQFPNIRSLSEQTGIPYRKVVHYCRLALLQLPSYSLEEQKSALPRKHSRRQQATCALYETFLRDDLEQCFSVLEPKERDILCLRYGWEDGEPMTLNEIGCIFQLTEEGVRRIERRALTKIRKCAQVETLKFY